MLAAHPDVTQVRVVAREDRSRRPLPSLRPAILDSPGRTADHHLLRPRGWDKQTRLDIREQSGLLLITEPEAPGGCVTGRAVRPRVKAAVVYGGCSEAAAKAFRCT